MKLRRLLAPSLRALLAHRLRVGLVTASVAAGVAAVVATGGIGRGASHEVLAGIESVGTNLLVVRPLEVKRLAARRSMRGAVTTLEPDDAAAIARLPSIAAAAPGVEAPARARANGRAMVTKVLGTSPEFPAIRRFTLARGRHLDEEDEHAAARVAVLGARLARGLFGDEDPVGQTVRLRGVPFEVVGVLEAKGAQVGGSDEDNQALVPSRTALRRVFNVTWLSMVFVRVRDGVSTETGEAEVRELLHERHGRLDVAVQSQAKAVSMQRRAAESLALVTLALSGVSLLVGGSGILALMLLSVKERTGEIGLRVAVGARPRDILVQLLLEAAFLSLAGWAAGAVAGGLGLAAVAKATGWRVALPYGALLSSFAMAVATGLGFGAFPARAASRIPPVVALSTR